MFASLKKYIKRKLEKKVIQPVYIPTIQGKMLTGKTALITGGTSGIGLALAEACARCGCNMVIITGRNQERAEKTALKLASTYETEVRGIELDLTRANTIEHAFNKALEFSDIHILFNNAGIYDGSSFGNVDAETFDNVINTNLRGSFILSQYMSKHMIEKAIPGNICNICSSSSFRPAIDPYMLSKWGLRGFTLGLAKKLIKHGIVVNGIAPGPTATPMLMNMDDINLQHGRIPAGRYATAEEIANLAVFLVSGMGRMIVGDVISITGGAAITTFDDVNNYM